MTMAEARRAGTMEGIWQKASHLLPFGQRRKPQPPTMAGYWRPSFIQRNRKKLLVLFALVSVIYGIFFSVLAPYLPVPLLLPLFVLALIAIWLLPETGRAPVKLLSALLFAMIIGLLCWPDYLAFAPPGVPWITVMRLITTPMTIVFLLCLSLSASVRQRIKDVLSANKVLWTMLAGYIIICFATVVFSKTIMVSLNRVVISQLYWTIPFFVSCYIFSFPGKAWKFPFFLWVILLFVMAIGFLEWHLGYVVWANHIPSFLKIEDESVLASLQGTTRAGAGLGIRVQSKFTTPLGYAEYMALSMPFVLHIAIFARQLWVRIAAFATIPTIFVAIISTDSRLGAVGFFATLIAYIFFIALRRWMTQRDSLFGPAITLAYPVLFSMFIAATFLIGRLRKMVWGSGQHQASSDARDIQIDMGIPKILSQPWGYGFARSGETLGYTTPGGMLTIDNYYLAVALDVGILGFVLYYGMILAGVAGSAFNFSKARTTDTSLLVPLAVALGNFFVIKSVFSQTENHPLVFVMLGMLCALVWRVKSGNDEPPPGRDYLRINMLNQSREKGVPGNG